MRREGGEARVIGKVNRFKYAHAIAFWCLLNWVNLDKNSVFKNQGRWNKNLCPDRLNVVFTAIIAYVIDGLGTRLIDPAAVLITCLTK